jgi:hypothetical protein
MPTLEKLQDQLKQLMLEQSESFNRRTFLGMNEEDIKGEEQRIRLIRELSAEFLKALHHSLANGDALKSHECGHCDTAAKQTSGVKKHD